MKNSARRRGLDAAPYRTRLARVSDHGQGVMLGRDTFIRDEVASGHLVRLMCDRPALRTFDYYVVYPEGVELSSKARLFRDWMLEQAMDPTL